MFGKLFSKPSAQKEAIMGTPAPEVVATPPSPNPVSKTGQNPIELKIKAKSLAAESQIIRQEEYKLTLTVINARLALLTGEYTPEQIERLQKRIDAARFKRSKIRDHRTDQVRSEARHTHLARAFLKGIPYDQVERWVWYGKGFPNFDRVAMMAFKYADGDSRITSQRYEQWMQGARDALGRYRAGLEAKENVIRVKRQAARERVHVPRPRPVAPVAESA